MTRIVHTTNTFLDRRNMGKRRRQDDYLAVFAETIDHAIAVDADAVVHTGNLFWTQSPDEEVLQQCREHLERCRQAGIECCLLRGERDRNIEDVVTALEDEGLLRLLEPRWNRIGDVAVFVNDGTVSDPESDFHYPPEDAAVRVAALADDLASTTGVDGAGAYESEVGWALDAILLGNQTRPVERIEDGVRILSPGAPERVVGKAFIDADSIWKPRVFEYDCTDDGVSVSAYETDARPVAAFRLHLEASDTLEDVRETLAERRLTDTATIFEIAGEKTDDSPTKSEIEAVVDESAAVTRGYDDRTTVERGADSSAAGDEETDDHEATEAEGEHSDQARGQNSDQATGGDTDRATGQGEPAPDRTSARLVAFGHVGGDGDIVDRIAEETAGDSVDAYVYTGTNRSVTQETDAQSRDSTVRASLGRLADRAPVYVIPPDGVSVWQADTNQYAPSEPPAPGVDTEGWPDGVTPIPFDGRVAVGDWFLTSNPLVGGEGTLLVTHEARPDQWHGGHAGYVAGGHFVGRHDRTYLNAGFASFDPGVGRDSLYGQYFSVTLDDAGLGGLEWTPLGMVERRTCPDHRAYGELFLLEDLACPFCAMESRPESDRSFDTPSTVYERAYLIASDDLPARRAHQVAYFSRYDVSPPSETPLDSFPSTADDGGAELDERALERGDLRGELMYFLDPATADDVWHEVRDLVARGDLYDARISTAFTRTARGDSQHLLLATVPNYADFGDAHRVHRRLTDDLGLDDPVSVKPTLYTDLGIYTSNASAWDLSRSTRYTVQADERPDTSAGLPEAPAVDNGSFPADLVDVDQWLLWKPASDGRKIPRAPWETGDDTFVSAMDEVNLTSFETASAYLDRLPGSDYGLAFTITEDDPFVLLDYDDARDPDAGVLPALVRQHIADADSYADVSTSGTGVHILARGELADEITAVVADLPDHEFSIEVYDSDRFVVMTGDRLAGTPTETTPAQGLLDRLQSEHATRRGYENRKTNDEPIKSRSELADIETTADIEDVFDSIKQVRPRDIRLRSTVTKERADGSKSLDPSWTTSETGTRLGQLDDVWIYRKGMHALDALQVVALEERLITHPAEYPSGETFWEAVEALRERGAHVPRYDPPAE